MKRLAMVLAVTFTMGLAASTVTASNVKDEKTKKETTETKKSCCSEGKTCCAKDKKAETPKK